MAHDKPFELTIRRVRGALTAKRLSAASIRLGASALRGMYGKDNTKVARRTLAGETTTGAANPAAVLPLSDPHFGMFVPRGEVRNPYMRKNWEGVGVLPDVAVGLNFGARPVCAFEGIRSHFGCELRLRPDMKCPHYSCCKVSLLLFP